MSVFRVNRTKNYTVMSNCHFKDKRLSLKAKGLLSQMLSLPDDWDYSMNGLAAINKENISAIKSALKELRLYGYLRIIKIMPDKTNSGRIEYIYDIFEQPEEQQAVEKQDIKKQDIEKQAVDFLPLEIQPVEKHIQLNNKDKITNDKINKNKINDYICEFEKLWEIYPRKQGKSIALTSFVKARKNGVSFDEILKGLENYIKYIRKAKIKLDYIKNASTWFTQECWNDEFEKNNGSYNSDSSIDYKELDRIK